MTLVTDPQERDDNTGEARERGQKVSPEVKAKGANVTVHSQVQGIDKGSVVLKS